MLTSDLLRVRVVKDEIRPQYVKVDAPQHLGRAEQLLGVFSEAIEKQASRAELYDAVREVEGLSTDHKFIKGLAKLLFDRCSFSPRALPMEDAPDAAALRQRLYALSAARGPLARRAGPTGRTTAETLFAEVAAELGCTTEQVSDAMYADLNEEQRLTQAKLPADALALLNRYNVSLVQSVLLRATRLTLTLNRPAARRLRQLFRYLKFHQLMYRVTSAPPMVTLEVDGPLSLLSQSSRYGMQLATFFPGVLLQDRPWTLEAELAWGKKKKITKRFRVDHTLGLVSHYADKGAWRTQTEEWFEERFNELNPSWTLHPGEPIDLGNQRILIPDFTFRKGKRVAHLDIVGFWRRGYLETRLENTPPNVLLAVSRRRAADKKVSAAFGDQVIPFAEIIPAKKVLAMLEIIAEPRPRPKAKTTTAKATKATKATKARNHQST
jgi:predicted nuclease of restriction endonuclease-like RecB superfamily